MKEPKYLEVMASVRHWQDGKINGKEDIEGNMPFKKGDMWLPIVELSSGKILNWPNDTEAKIHYKVCDSGQYWILDEQKQRIAKWMDCYVPNDILCIKSNGYGDYIIFDVDVNGEIINWKAPEIDMDEWQIEEQF